jgi:hypothetical protein
VIAECDQQPQIMMVGSGDPGFPLEPAFYVRREPSGRGGPYRDGYGGRGSHPDGYGGGDRDGCRGDPLDGYRGG